jgi:hypothetical protein
MSATVVTCYYKFKSKHSFEDYDGWITNYLSTVQSNLIIFTSPDLKDYLLDKRPDHLKQNTRIICQELHELELAKKYENYWDYQYSIDNQKWCGRNKECYILWNSKLLFLKTAIELNIFKSDKFVWADIGSIRTTTDLNQLIYDNFPIYDKISNTQIDIILFNPIENDKQKVFIDELHLSGSMFGGHKDTILKFYHAFYCRFDEHITNNIFIGCDQQTISSVFNDNRELFNCIYPKQIGFNIWFYLWMYYSGV